MPSVLDRLPLRHLPLRHRVGVAFALVSLVVTGLFATVTWNLASYHLEEQRIEGAVRQADVNLRLVEQAVTTRPDGDGLGELLTGLAGTPDTTVALRRDGRWTTSGRAVDPELLPRSLLDAARPGVPAREQLVVGGMPALVVAHPMPGGDLLVEVFPIQRPDGTLRFLGLVLFAGVAVSTVLGLALGHWAGRRALLPLTELTRAAGRVAGGDLAARLPDSADAELAPLVATFNRTADDLEHRVQRDARFAADVSHELRSPLTTLVNAVAVLRRRRAELPPTAQQAVDLLDGDVQRFRRMVVDLLEISRSDDLEREPWELGELVRGLVAARGCGTPPEIDAPAAVTVHADRRRLDQVLGNLLDNADAHGGGALRVGVSARDGRARIEVDDDGPGVPAGRRTEVFERFSRGTLAGSRGDGGGTGLGLSLVAVHVRRHDGSVWIEDRPGGGARVVVELPGGGGAPDQRGPGPG
ncbi:MULTISPECIES: HAMP domain-containing sensor histidine kinase [unclassified Pseudonocardia]|uniref:sensor histidine kinase n=1 Tax=unclassified Pseudonocardia TaxID=2619320 RepID=UPI00052458D0|nr:MULTISPECIES: HAMP domain-containing sensor histidine kinase [unclassified Pseudonocardia]ALL78316.1 histidine kinase [Pseudonocardia sp. EC080610-09]ALL84516.1 histidine kinase [Pseudonocardia sp. EC080619-01]